MIQRVKTLTIENARSIGWFLFGFALMVAYWPGVSGVATTPRWDVGAMLALAMFFAPRVQMRAVHWLGLALLAWLITSLIWSLGRLDGIDWTSKFILVAIAFALGSTLDSIKPLVVGCGCGMMICGGFTVAQYLGWIELESYGPVSGLFFNSDRLAAISAEVAAAAVALRAWWLIPGLAPCLILPQSRGALLAVVASLVVFAWQNAGRWSRSLAIVFCGIAFLFVSVAAFILAYRGYDVGITERISLYRDTIAGLTFWGHGLGSFWESFPRYAQHFDLTKSRPDHPHSEWLWIAYEGGVVGFCLLCAFAGVLWRTAVEPIRIVLVALFVESLFAMPFHDPATVLFGALCAGYLARWRDPVFDLADKRRVSLRTRLASGIDGRQHARA